MQHVPRLAAPLPLPTPSEICATFPLDERCKGHVADGRRAIENVLAGVDQRRLVMIVGPCSIHDAEAALEYGARLVSAAHRMKDALVLVMRAYLEKPRSRFGWKGMLADPHLDGSHRIDEGLTRGRKLLVELNAIGIRCATELLGLLTPPYIDDLLVWGALGARTTESQPHRELFSALPFPVGVKNTTDGTFGAALDAIHAIGLAHRFATIDAGGRVCMRQTAGNRYAHLVLRGGKAGTNYDPTSVSSAARASRQETKLARPVFVDASHGNSERRPERQVPVVRAVLDQVAEGNRAIGGLMIESNLEAGKQELVPGRGLLPGVSVTDGCLGWAETEALLEQAAHAVRSRRSSTFKTYVTPASR
jgi:3-deoxy-7-phosphoheptulonate synthase